MKFLTSRLPALCAINCLEKKEVYSNLFKEMSDPNQNSSKVDSLCTCWEVRLKKFVYTTSNKYII